MAELFNITSIDHRTLVLLDDITVSENEEYLNGDSYSFQFSGYEFFENQYSVATRYDFLDSWIITAQGNPNPSYNMRHALYLDYLENPAAPILRFYNPNNRNLILFARNGSISYSYANIPGNYNTGTTYVPVMYTEVAINIPVFETLQDAIDYVEAEDETSRITALKKAYNYRYPAEEEGDEFEISNSWIHGTWTKYGVSTSGNIAYRNVKGKIGKGGVLTLYKMPYETGDTALKYGVLANATFSGLQYSVNGINWQNVDSFPFDFFYREREDELGSFDFAYSLSFSRFTIWENENDARDFLQGNKDIEEALNWPEISSGYPVFNPTGDELEQTSFGHVYTEGFFSQQYILNATALREIANGLFDTQNQGIWESIKKGIEMFGADPIQAVMGLSYWPFPISSIFSNISSQRYVYFGGYQFDFSDADSSCYRIIYPDGYKTIASTQMIKRRFHSWRDFEPYTKLYIMLPYIGTYQLDLARYYDKVLEVRYYCDTRTNSIIAALIADGTLIDYFNGQMGCTMPISLSDYSGFANAQIQTLLGGGGQAVGTFSNAAGTVGQVASLGTAGLLAGGAVAAGGAALSGAAIGAKTVYGLSQNNINNFNKTKGGSTSMINQFLPQKVTLIWEMMEDCAPSNYGQMFGYPSMMAGKLSSFSGFLKCQAVKLVCPVATERERERLKQMLLSGIYI